MPPSTRHQAPKPETVVIAGAGIMGVSTAYFLARDHEIANIVLIDPTGTVAPAASGKAAGFLALDWRDDTLLKRLCRRSFQLHKELAAELGEETIQYRPVSSCALIELEDDDEKERKRSNKTNKRNKNSKSFKRQRTDDNSSQVEWAKVDQAKTVEIVGNEESLAQVNPKLLCEALWNETQKLTTCQLIKGRLVEIQHEYKKGKSKQQPAQSIIHAKLEYEEETIQADALLVACGPWSANFVTGSKASSVVLPTSEVGKQCVFFSCGSDCNFEGFVRPDNTMFCSGLSEDNVRVTEQPGKEEPNRKIVDQLVHGITEFSKPGFVLPPTDIRACYQPTTPDDLPMMGELADLPRCYMATGHNCWGILMGPGTGEIMAHLIATGRTSNSIRPFDPNRFGKLQLVPSVEDAIEENDDDDDDDEDEEGSD